MLAGIRNSGGVKSGCFTIGLVKDWRLLIANGCRFDHQGIRICGHSQFLIDSNTLRSISRPRRPHHHLLSFHLNIDLTLGTCSLLSKHLLAKSILLRYGSDEGGIIQLLEEHISESNKEVEVSLSAVRGKESDSTVLIYLFHCSHEVVVDQIADLDQAEQVFETHIDLELVGQLETAMQIIAVTFQLTRFDFVTKL